MTEPIPDDEITLDLAQRTRVAALGFARAALADGSETPLTSRDSLPKRFGVDDLTRAADWILGDTRPVTTVVVVPDDAVEAVSRLNPAENFRPGGLLIVPESVDRWSRLSEYVAPMAHDSKTSPKTEEASS